MSNQPSNPQDDADLVKIGDLARLAEVTTRTVRFYEGLDLIQPASRSSGGFRLYRRDQAERLLALLSLKEVGFSLDDIRAYRDLANEGDVALEVMARLRQRISDGATQLRARIVRLQGALGDLERTEETLDKCHGCDGKAYEPSCHDCWKEMAGGTLPDALKAVI